MKLPPAVWSIPPRGAALRGVFYTTVHNGRMVIRKWPRRQPSTKSPRANDNRELLKSATIASLYMDAHQQLFSRKLAEKTPLLPRDLLMMSLFGRIGTIVLTDGRKLYSMAARQDVSDILDAITQTPGALLTRGDTWWQEVPIGEADQVLSVDSDGNLYWRDTVSSLGVGGHWLFAAPPMLPDAASTNITSNFWVGTAVIMPADTHLTGLKLWLQNKASLTHGYAAVYRGNATGGLAGGLKVRQGPPVTISANGLQTFVLDSPALLIGGEVYWVGVNCRGSGNYATAQGVPRLNSFFSLNSDIAPNPAPAVTSQLSNNNPIWGY